MLLSGCGGYSSGGSDSPTDKGAEPGLAVLTIVGEQEVAAATLHTLLAHSDEASQPASWRWSLLEGGALLSEENADQERFQYQSIELNSPARIRLAVERLVDGRVDGRGEKTIEIRRADDLAVAPLVDAGPTVSAAEGEQISLLSSVTARNGRSIRALYWQQLTGPRAELVGAADQDRLQLILPQIEQPRQLMFSLTARDSGGFIASDNVLIEVQNSNSNRLPVVDAGPDIEARGREQVSLLGSATDPDGQIVRLLWQALGEDEGLTIDGADTLNPSFIAPNPRQARDLRLRLSAWDNDGGQASDERIVRLLPVANQAPTIESIRATPGLAYSGETVVLSGVASDSDGDPIHSQWRQRPVDGGPELALRDADKAEASFIVPSLSEAATVEIEWLVSDGRNQSQGLLSIQLLPRQEADPDPLSCLTSPLQPGCPLYPLSAILDPQAFLACSNPLSSACILGDLIGPSLRRCLRDPSAAECADAVLDITDPSYVLEQLGPEAPADHCTPAFEPGTFRDYIGAMHEHTAYSDGTPLTRPSDVYRRVKNMGYDFAASSDHSDNMGLPLSTGIGRAECPPEKFLYCLFLVDEARPLDAFAKWSATLEQSQAASDDGFTAIRGFEWTSDRFGHANVYFSRNFINAKTGPGYAVSMALFWQWFSYPAQFGGGSDGLLSFNHPGREDALEAALGFVGGDPAFTFNDFRYVDSADYRVVGLEVFGKGSEYDSDGPNGSWLSYALDKGWHLAPISSEDHHGSQWGDPSLPKTVIRARSSSLDDLREALLARRVYAVAQHYDGLRLDYRVASSTMGARLRQPVGTALPFSVELSRDGQPMSGARIQLVGPANTILAEGVGGQLSGELPIQAQKSYAFVRVLDGDNGDRPVAFSAPVWLIPGATPLPLCQPPPLWQGDSVLYPALPR